MRTLFLRLLLDTGRYFTWSSKPREGLAICTAKAVPSFLRYLSTLSIGPAAGIDPRPPALQTSALPTKQR